MCLLTLNRDPMVAEKDIICYKVLLCSWKNGDYYTPFQEVPVTVPSIIVSASEENLQEYEIEAFTRITLWKVKGEGVHAYIEKEIASLNLINVWFQDPATIVRCRIPAGTEYWEGKHGEIAARKILLEEEEK